MGEKKYRWVTEELRPRHFVGEVVAPGVLCVGGGDRWRCKPGVALKSITTGRTIRVVSWDVGAQRAVVTESYSTPYRKWWKPWKTLYELHTRAPEPMGEEAFVELGVVYMDSVKLLENDTSQFFKYLSNLKESVDGEV